MLRLVARSGELFTDRSDRLRVDAKLFRCALGQLLQVEMRRPLAFRSARTIARLDITLVGVAVIPDLIAGKSMSSQRFLR